MDLFDIRAQIAHEIADPIRPDELPRFIATNTTILVTLRERNPGVVKKLRPWRVLIIQSLPKWDADAILDGLYETRPDHYNAIAMTPGGFDWFRRNVAHIQASLPALLG